jgi:hypothetical protein
MRRLIEIAGAAAVLLTLAACTAGSPGAQHAANGGLLLQFLLGVWHGIIAPFTLIGEVLNDFVPHLLPWSVRFYESKGTGVPYDVGFYLGLVGSPLAIGGRWRRG